MKNWIKLGLCGLMVVSLSGCGGSGKSNVDPQEVYGCSTLNVYNWGSTLEKTSCPILKSSTM